MKVLIAEDDVSQQRLLAHLSRMWGYTPLVVGTGPEAIDALRAKDVQLAVLDWDLPGASGLEVCRGLQRTDRVVHAIVLTANDDVEDAAVALEAGASDYLTKPFSRTELRARLRVGRRMLELHAQLAKAQKLESIGQLAAGIAHEINTPAQFVSDNLHFVRDGCAGLLRLLDAHEALLTRARTSGHEPELTSRIGELAEEIDLAYLRQELSGSLAQSIEGITRIAVIVRAMKTFSHPSQGERKLSDLNELVRSTTAVSRHEWKHIATLELDLDPNLPLVSCMPGEFNQALLNIVVNAAHAICDAHGENPAQGSLRVASRLQEHTVVVSVADNGGGIPTDVRDRIFDPFFTTKEVGRGTGQGLAIAYDVIANKHGGQLRLETKEGVGTTFSIELPLHVDEPES